MPLRAPKGFIDESDPKVCQIGHPAPPWLINYADLMTELVCFFVIMYALSAALNKNVQAAAQQVKEMIDKKEITGEVKVDREGLKILLEEKGKASFFESGAADTTQEIDAMIMKLVPTLVTLSKDHDIIIEGHTDDQPISNPYYDSNWELSTSRATAVARLLIDKYGLPAGRLGAIGYGQYRPIVPNDTPDHRAMNRRVVFFVKDMPPAPQPATPPEATPKPAAG
jgi:flagellar motor protein MotB